MTSRWLLLILGFVIVGVVIGVLTLTPAGDELGAILETAFAPTDIVVIGEPVSVTPTAINTPAPTVVPTNTPTPTMTPTPTPIPPTIRISLEGGEIFLKVEEALDAAFVSYNEANGTDFEFESILIDFRGLEPGAEVIELLDVDGNVIGYIPDSLAGWCIIDCEDPVSLVIQNFAMYQLDDIEATMDELVPNSRLGLTRGLVYLDSPDTKCGPWMLEEYPFMRSFPAERFFLVDTVFSEALFDLGINHMPVRYSGCPYYEQ